MKKSIRTVVLVFLTMVILLSSVTGVSAVNAIYKLDKEKYEMITTPGLELIYGNEYGPGGYREQHVEFAVHEKLVSDEECWLYDFRLDNVKIVGRYVYIDFTYIERLKIYRPDFQQWLVIRSKDGEYFEGLRFDTWSGYPYATSYSANVTFTEVNIETKERRELESYQDVEEGYSKQAETCVIYDNFYNDLEYAMSLAFKCYYETTVEVKGAKFFLPEGFNADDYEMFVLNEAPDKSKNVWTTAVFENHIDLASVEMIPAPGDADDNGYTNLADVQRMMEYIVGWDVEFDPDICDTNGDGILNLRDVSFWLKYIAGWDVVLVK